MGLYVRRVLFVNASVVAALLIIVSFMWGGGISLTGYTLSEFYDSDVMRTINPISNERTTFVIPVTNQESTPIEDLYVQIVIETLQGEAIVTIDSEPIFVDANSESEINAVWDNTVSPGVYVAKIYLFSEASDAVFVKTFEILPQTLSIESIQVSDFKLGEVLDLDVIIENNLQEDVTDVTLNLLIYGDNSEVLQQIEAESFVLPRASITKLNTTWDTSSLSSGTYRADLVVSGGGYDSQRDISFTVSEDSFRVIGTGFAVNYTPRSSFDTGYLVIIVIAGLVLANILVWFLFVRGKK